MKPDDTGACSCADSSFLIGGSCQSLSVTLLTISLSLLGVVAIILSVMCVNKLTKKENIEVRLFRRTKGHLRKRLGITKRGGYLLSSERAPFWRRQKSFTVIQDIHFDAAVCLALLRDDFDVRHLDAFCILMLSTSQYNLLCEWLLEQIEILLNPMDGQVYETLAGLARVGRLLARVFSAESISDHAGGWLKHSTQQERFMYFVSRIGRLSVLKEDGMFLFNKVKDIVEMYMDDLGTACTRRFEALVLEDCGKHLVEFDGRDITEAEPSKVQGFDEMIKSQEVVVCEDHKNAEPATLDCGDNQREKNKALLICSRDAAAITRQDHEQVKAIRVGLVDLVEANLNVQGRASKAPISAAAFSRTRSARSILYRLDDGASYDHMDEEMFLSQLAMRARLLNLEFQDRALSIVNSHAADEAGAARHSPEPTPRLSIGWAARSKTVRCAFVDGPAAVDVACPAPKRVSRMREKLKKYSPPHPKAVWPLCANILDPVRISIVCKGASEILQVLSWFTHPDSRATLPICRIKNKFGLPAAEVQGGYRDLQLSVLFEGSQGLRIIGEIQIHDREMYSLKSKMHKLYALKRASSPDALCLE